MIPAASCVITAFTTFVLWRYFRRSKRIVVYINLILSITLLTASYLTGALIWFMESKIGLNQAQHVVDVMEKYFNSTPGLSSQVW